MGNRTAATVSALAVLAAAVAMVAAGVVPWRAAAAGAAQAGVLQAGAWRAGLELSAGVRPGPGDAGPEAAGPEGLEPRAGGLMRLTLEAAAGRWAGGATLAVDGRQVPFRRAGDGWQPGAVGLRHPPAAEARLDEAWVEWAQALWVGRRRFVLGGGTGLVEEAGAPGLDQVGLRLGLGGATYRKVVGRLEPGERYLLAHQLDLGPLATAWGTVRLSGYELGVVGPRFFAQPFTWIPLWPGYLTQDLEMARLGNDESNFFIGVAAEVGRPLGWAGRVRAELLVDDMPMRAHEPILYQVAGAAVVEAEAGWAVRYARVNNYVGTFQNPALSLVHAGRLLALADGPDTDSWRLTWRRPAPGGEEAGAGAGVAGRPAVAGVSLEWRRRGPGRVGDIWEDVAKAFGFPEAKAREFLGGTVEHALLAGVEVALAGGGRVGVTAGPVWNVANRPGERSWLVRLGVALSAAP